MHCSYRYLSKTLWLIVAAASCFSFFTMTALAASPTDPINEAISHGRTLFTQPSFGGNGKACQSCHLGGGLKPGRLPDGKVLPSLSNAAAIFPRVNRRGKLVTLHDQVRQCVIGAIEGTAPPAYDSAEMRALVTYLTSLSQGKPIEMNGQPR